MRSFSILSIAATLAFSAFTSALPVNHARDLIELENNSINADVLKSRDLIELENNKINADVLKNRDLLDIEDNEINADVLRSRDELKSIPTILTDLTNDLSAVIDELSMWMI